VGALARRGKDESVTLEQERRELAEALALEESFIAWGNERLPSLDVAAADQLQASSAEARRWLENYGAAKGMESSTSTYPPGRFGLKLFMAMNAPLRAHEEPRAPAAVRSRGRASDLLPGVPHLIPGRDGRTGRAHARR